jgi:tetratricopeptide (TPR) repeat protein
MQYDLDPRLLPPGGTSVQCTRCRFVFTATPTGVLLPPSAPAPVPSPTPTAAPPLNNTLIFGSSRSVPAPTPPVAPPSAPAPASVAPPPSEPSPSTTQPFGALPADFFPPGQTPPFGSQPVTERPAEKTQPFGRPASPSKTQIFGAGELAEAVARAEAAQAAQSTQNAQAAPVSLPPEPLAPPATPHTSRAPASPRRLPHPPEPPPDLLAGRPSRRTPSVPRREPERSGGLLFMGGFLGVLLLVVAAVGYPIWRKRAAELPAESIGAREEAVALLRRDDGASREQAILLLRALMNRHPAFVEAQADMAVALALDLDDARAELDRLQIAEERLDGALRALANARGSVDWTVRVNALEDELASVRREREPLATRVKTLVRDVEQALEPLRTAAEEEPASATLARIRAQAVHAGVLGSSQTQPLAQQLRTLEPPPHHWAVVARASHALNVKAPPDVLAEAASALEAVREQDRTFLRAYVLGARLALKQGDPATAQALLDAAVVLNPNHALARRLQAWATAEARAAASSP